MLESLRIAQIDRESTLVFSRSYITFLERNGLKTQIVNYINGDIKMDEILYTMKEILEEQIILLNLLLMENKNEMR